MKKIMIPIFIFTAIVFSLSPEEPILTAEGAVLMDHLTGRILYDKEGECSRPPASMTKLVTLYLGCEALEEGRFHRDTRVRVTETGSAFSRPPGSSLMLLEEGQTLDYLTLLRGIAVASGNDGAYQLAELISGSPDNFVASMNLLTYSMGLEEMVFVDPDGWSDMNRVTPRSYAEFSRRYIDAFPWALEELHSQRSLTYPREENRAPDGLIQSVRTKKNTNLLLGVVDGVDGLKSGYIDEAGFNMTVTALRGKTRLIAVLMGIHTENYREGLALRAEESERLLEYGFSRWSTAPLPDRTLSLKVYKGEAEVVILSAEDRPPYTYSPEEKERMVVRLDAPPWVKAPLDKGVELGRIFWELDGRTVGEAPLVTQGEIKKGGFFHNLIDIFEILFYNLSHKEGGQE